MPGRMTLPQRAQRIRPLATRGASLFRRVRCALPYPRAVVVPRRRERSSFSAWQRGHDAPRGTTYPCRQTRASGLASMRRDIPLEPAARVSGLASERQRGGPARPQESSLCAGRLRTERRRACPCRSSDRRSRGRRGGLRPLPSASGAPVTIPHEFASLFPHEPIPLNVSSAKDI